MMIDVLTSSAPRFSESLPRVIACQILSAAADAAVKAVDDNDGRAAR